MVSTGLIHKCPKPKCPKPEPKINLSCPKDKYICDPKPCPVCEQSIIKRMAKNVEKEYQYEANEFDCTQFSNELARRLRKKGFDAYVKKIQVDCDAPRWQGTNCEEFNGWHEVVVVEDLYIESTTGNVIDPQNYDAYNLE